MFVAWILPAAHPPSSSGFFRGWPQETWAGWQGSETGKGRQPVQDELSGEVHGRQRKLLPIGNPGRQCREVRDYGIYPPVPFSQWLKAALSGAFPQLFCQLLLVAQRVLDKSGPGYEKALRHTCSWKLSVGMYENTWMATQGAFIMSQLDFIYLYTKVQTEGQTCS